MHRRRHYVHRRVGIIQRKKRTTFKSIQQLMAAKQWDEFDRLLDGKLTSMLYPRYNRDYLRLNSYLLRDDHKRAD